MPIGPSVRKILGPLERPISDLYRGIFIDISDFARQSRQWVSASRILELGCGEGAVTERLTREFSDAHITGIDIIPRVGRMFQGDLSRVTFKQETIQNFAEYNATSFDLLVICDVMHHIPREQHEEILMDAGKTLQPGGYLILKDWDRDSTLINLLCYVSDRYITGDHIHYKTAEEWRKLIRDVFGTDSIKAETRIQPWRNNIAFLAQI